MSIQFIEGFDLYDSTVNASSKGWSSNPSSYQVGRFGGQCFRFVSNSSAGGVNSQFVLPTATSNFACGFAYRNNDVLGANNNTFFRVQNGATVLITLQVSFVTRQIICSYAGGSFTSTNIATLSGFDYYEIEAVFATGTGGSINLYCNGALVGNVAAANTGTGPATLIQIVAATGASNVFCTNDFDDMYINTTATRTGEAKVETLRATADNGTNQWTPNSGTTHFNRVNETTSDGDTTYLFSATSGQLDYWNMSSLGSIPAHVFAVQDTMMARKDDAGTKQVCTQLISGATTVSDTTFNLSTSYATFCTIHQTDPNTSAAWTGAAVNAAILGINEVS